MKQEQIKRKKTRIVKIGDKYIGGDNPILVQSMTNTKTSDTKATIDQIKRVEEAGCEIIRVSTPDMESVKALEKIKNKISIPLVADIHFEWKLAVESINYGADKIRINPGNIDSQEGIEKIVETSKKNDVSIRVGINSGSLPKDIIKKYDDKVTPEGMAEAALRSIKILEDLDFWDIVVSVKSTDVLATIKCHEILSKKGDWPIHLGITESGRAMSGIIKSSIGIGDLLLKGIGDTIRVSLTGDPVEEVKAGWEILKSTKIRERGLSIISCPTCARTSIPVEDICKYLEDVADKFGEDPKKFAVMGCIVNGLGEAKQADLALVGNENDEALFFKDGEYVQTIKPEKIRSFIDELVK